MTVFSLWTFAALLFILQTDVAVKGHPTQNLHHHMTKREIEHFFGVNDHEKVPEYDIASPYQSNDQGDFVSYSLHPSRTKRDAEPHEPSFYKLDAFGSKHHLKLKLNEHLMDPNLTIVSRNSDGTTTKHPAPRNTFYLGHVVSDPRSTVAISNDGGFTGLVKTSRDTLFVHPLPAHLAKHVTSNEDAMPHLVYRRSLKENDFLCETTRQAEEDIRLKRSAEAEDFTNKMSDSPPPVIVSDSVTPKFKTLKAALLYPAPLKQKYSTGNLKGYFGNVHDYLLVVANMVAGMFHDPSFGKIKIAYVVTSVKEIVPAEYKFNLSDNMITKVVRITSKLKKEKQSYDVFSYVSNAISGGAVAAFNQACRSKPVGNANSDIGLQTSLHIAHEIGHNMGLGHGHGSCAGYIMHSNIPGGEHATEWSKCSRDAIQKFLADRSRSNCLDDGPAGIYPSLPPRFRNKLPGQILGGDGQCETHYGEGWKRYDVSQCKYLKCLKGYTMLSKHTAVADGTKCGHNQWCIKGKCSGTDNLLTSTPGVWSEWSPYSDCSKECGTGFQRRSRSCLKTEFEKHCKGHHEEYILCQKKECPNGTPPPSHFRQMACVNRTDGFTVVYIRGACSMWCRKGYHAKHVGTIPDGISCTHPEAHAGVCKHGTCRMVGCDGLLNSRKVLDRCGVCGGLGTRCRKISNTFTDNPKLSGPDNALLIAELPQGTRSAFFQILADTHHYLGVQDVSGRYLVGAHLGGSTNKPFAGTIITYYHRRRSPGKDAIQILNPTNAVLRVVYIKKDKYNRLNPGVRYQFIVPSQIQAGPGSPDDFEWKPDKWSGCSRPCASGIRTRNRRCVRKDDKSRVDDSACGGPAKETEPCNIQPCKATWVLNWTPCSKTCGQGKQVQTYKCIEKVNETQFRETNTCTSAKPAQSSIPSRLCNHYPCPAEWSVGNWSQCPNKCAVGKIQRSVSCSRIDEAGRFTVIADWFCRFLDQKPASEGKCNEDNPCGPRPSHCPADHVCSNGGQCQPDPAGYKCVCDRGFTGVECEIKINPCDNNPCLNGGSCSPGVNHHFDHTCQCKEQFTGKNCETAVTACDKNPCLNNGTCTDNGTYDKYNCACPKGFVGEQCQVSGFYKIGCFNYKRRVIPALPQDPQSQSNEPPVLKCAERAQQKGYRFFALGVNGMCYSGPEAGKQYFRYGSANKCKNGVGNRGAAFVYTFDPLPTYEKLGCYVADKGRKKKALSVNIMNLRNQFNSKYKKSTIDRCARIALAKKFTYFALQKGSLCVSDKNAAENYDKYGPSSYCKDGVGWKANMVYKIKVIIPTYVEQLGCYNSKKKGTRRKAFRKKFKSVSGNSQVIEECAKAAYKEGFLYFSVRNRVHCFSDSYPAERYAMFGPSQNCKDGVGLSVLASMVYRFKKVPLGCFFAMKPRQPKAFNTKLRDLKVSKGTKAMIDDCAKAALAKGFTYFSVRNSVCWSDQNAAQIYNKYGPSPKCQDGVGLHGTNAVYKFGL